jgi:hypothetical protein
MSTAHKHKKRYGMYPNWYISDGTWIKIDEDEYEYLGILEHKAWIFSTDQLFWAFQDLDICCMELSRMLSRMSEKYTSVISWNSFIANNLFSIPPDIILIKDKSMRIEFLQHGTRIIYNMIKRGEIEIQR